ncbi:MAG: class I SAM-dependent methyltransferase [Pleurocapsa sp.]
MLKKFLIKLISLVKLDALILFRQSGYLQQIGWVKSFRLKQPIDRDLQPLPWYTYSAIEYIKQLDFSHREVFEYGSGNSTIFWSKLAKRVVSIENNQQWYELVAKSVAKNVEIKLIKDDAAYIQAILQHENFDVIVIDGSYRLDCATTAINRLKPGGFIILDNSDWHVKTAKVLRDANLIQVDLTGLGPINHYAWTTSFFLHRDFNLQPKGNNQPEHGTGALKQYAQEQRYLKQN